MKYQFILDGVVVFESNNHEDYFNFLIKEENKDLMYATLFDFIISQTKGIKSSRTTVKSNK